ncbi:MAG: MFS transporter [Candidatus Heimdallarchaeota archaeon]|nr:MFS transporter [Candidatus Heimdallarchaeota archaeon]
MELIHSKSILNPSKLQKYLAMSSFFLSLLSLGGIWSSIAIFIPLIQDSFNIGIIESSLLFVVMLLPVPFSALIARPFKKYGMDIVVLAGSFILSFFGTLHPFIGSYPLLLIVRFCAASGFGLLFMYHNAILSRYTPPSQNTKNTLLLMTGLVTGAFGSSFFTIYLYSLFNANWQLSVAFWGIIGLFATCLWLLYMVIRRKEEQK